MAHVIPVNVRRRSQLKMASVVKWAVALTRISPCQVLAALLSFVAYILHRPADQVNAGTVDIKYIDTTVEFMLRTKFALGLFESGCR